MHEVATSDCNLKSVVSNEVQANECIKPSHIGALRCREETSALGKNGVQVVIFDSKDLRNIYQEIYHHIYQDIYQKIGFQSLFCEIEFSKDLRHYQYFDSFKISFVSQKQHFEVASRRYYN